jgi:hypothetical protein
MSDRTNTKDEKPPPEVQEEIDKQLDQYEEELRKAFDQKFSEDKRKYIGYAGEE